MNQRVPFLLAALMLGVAFVPLAPGAAADTASKTWTQTSQIDFAQGSGSADVYRSSGNVFPGGGVSTDVSGRWTTEADGGCANWCFDRYQTGSPYVASGQGSIYMGRGAYYNYCCYRTWNDRISTPAPNQEQFTLYLYPAGGYQERWYGAYTNLYFRVTDGSGNQQDTFLRGVRSNGWSSWTEQYGSYSTYQNINGWNWYKFDISVPSHFNKASLRIALHQNTYVDYYWNSGAQIYMWNHVAFGSPPSSEFVSNVHDAGGLATWDSVNIDGYVPSGATMKVQTRTSADGTAFSDWAAVLSGEPPASPAGRFIQYRALFTRAANGAEPYLSELRVSYSFAVDTNPPRTTASLNGVQGCAGWFVSPPVVVLSASDDHSGVAGTFFALDGGAFARYADPFAVGDGTHTLDFYSVDGAGNVETARSVGFKADTRVPSTALGIGSPSFQGDRLYVAPGTTFTLDASDATSGVKATRVDTGAGLGDYAGAFSLGGADGARSVAFQSEDRACNVEALDGAGVFVDATAPTVALLEPEPASFNVAGHDSEDVEPWSAAQDNLAAFGLYGSDADVLASILLASAEEACGAAAERCAALALAGLAPQFGGAVVVGDIIVEADAADPVVNGGASGLAGVAFLLDGVLQVVDTEAPYTWDWKASASSLGRHELTVVAVDNLGNTASVSSGVSVIPATPGGVLASGERALGVAEAPDFAQGLYAFARGKAEALALPPPPPPPPLPVPAEVVQAVRDALAGLPVPVPEAPLPDELPVEPPPLPVEPPVLPEVPGAPEAPEVPPVPQLCVSDVCTPTA